MIDPPFLPACLANAKPGQKRMILDEMRLLQPKAESVFGAIPDQDAIWYVTRRGLQQSTRQAVSQLKARWCCSNAQQHDSSQTPAIIDICGGLGGDAISFACHANVLSIDSNEVMTRYASANAKVSGVAERATFVTASAESDSFLSADIRDSAILHLDPDRRRDGRRQTHVHDLNPSWDVVFKWLNRGQKAWVKLAPATNLETAELTRLPHPVRVWISSARRVREQALLVGQWPNLPIKLGNRTAVVLRDNQTLSFSSDEPIGTSAIEAERVGRWLLDPDAAIRAAGLTASFANRFGLRSLGGCSGFLTTDDTPNEQVHGLAKVGQVVETLACREKKWKAFFRRSNTYPETIKVRGLDHNPSQIQQSCKALGDTAVNMWLGRTTRNAFCAITNSTTDSDLAISPANH